MSDFDVYQLPEDHETIRAAVREVCEARVAPNAAEADESGEFPKASYEALGNSALSSASAAFGATRASQTSRTAARMVSWSSGSW